MFFGEGCMGRKKKTKAAQAESAFAAPVQPRWKGAAAWAALAACVACIVAMLEWVKSQVCA